MTVSSTARCNPRRGRVLADAEAEDRHGGRACAVGGPRPLLPLPFIGCATALLCGWLV